MGSETTSSAINVKRVGVISRKPQKRDVLENQVNGIAAISEGMGLRGIGRTLKVSNVSVLRWIRSHIKEHVQLELPDDIRSIDIIEIDEMWHFSKKKNESFGYGLPLKVIRKKCLDTPLAVGVKKLSRHSLNKLSHTL